MLSSISSVSPSVFTDNELSEKENKDSWEPDPLLELDKPFSTFHLQSQHSPYNSPSYYPLFYGNKAANLIALEKMLQGCQAKIPSFLPLSHDTIYQYLDKHASSWKELWKKAYDSKSQQIHEPSLLKLQAYLRDAFKNHPLKTPAIDQWQASLPQNAKVTVRSSSLEDTKKIANPGGNLTVLEVLPTAECISASIGNVIASYFSYKSLRQRQVLGDNLSSIQLSVLLQHSIKESLKSSVPALSSGVLYTSKDALEIDAAFGHGEGVVSSSVSCDHFLIPKNGHIFAQVANKKERLLIQEGKMLFVSNSKELSLQPCLDENACQQLVKAASLIKQEFQQEVDLEFVYDRNENQLYIVQARPIPSALIKNTRAAFIASNKLESLKKQTQILDLFLLTHVDLAPCLITKKEDLLVCETLSDALQLFLSEKKPTCKILVVKEKAPEFSHEAAQFNQMGVHVLYLADVKNLEKLITSSPYLLFDSQRSVIVNLKPLLKKNSRPNLATLTKPPFSLLELGVRASGKNLTPSIISNDFFPQNIVLAKSYLAKHVLLNNCLEKSLFNSSPKAFYTHLSSLKHHTKELKTHLSSLFSAHLENIYQANKHVDSSLKFIIKQLFQTYQKTPSDRLKHILLQSSTLCSAIEGLIPEKKATPPSLTYLSLVKSLENILLKDSLEAHEDSFFSYLLLENQYQEFSKDNFLIKKTKTPLKTDQKALLISLIEKQDYFLQENNKRKWALFVTQALLENKLSYLSFYVNALEEKGLLSAYLNQLAAQDLCFKDYDKKKLSSLFSSGFSKLTCQYKNLEADEKALELQEKEASLKRWQNQLRNWQDPDKFDSLFKHFQEDFIPSFTSLKLTASPHLLTKKRLLRLYVEMTDLYDKSIKSLKLGGMYKDQESLLLERFKLMIEPYVGFMTSKLTEIPKSSALWNKFDFPQEIANSIQKALEIKLKSSSSKQLFSTPGFSVQSAALGSRYRCSYSLLPFLTSNQITLEDLFSLAHQNLLAYSLHFSKDILPSQTHLPQELQTLLNIMGKHQEALKLELINLESDAEKVHLFFNSPQNEHSFTFKIDYNLQTKSADIQVKLYGKNYFHRLTRLITELILEKQLYKLPLNFKVPLRSNMGKQWTPENPQELEINWNLNAKDLSNTHFLQHFVVDLFKRHCMFFPLKYHSSPWRLARYMMRRYLRQKNEELDLQALIKSCQNELKKYPACLKVTKQMKEPMSEKKEVKHLLLAK